MYELQEGDTQELLDLYYRVIKPRYARLSRTLAAIDAGIDLDPFQPCEQDLLDRPQARQFPDLLDEEEEEA